MDDDVNEEQILNLWKDISFPGSFRGVKTFQALLKTDKNIDISEKQLYEILKKEPNFLIHQVKPFKPSYRSYVTHNYGELIQSDKGKEFVNKSTKELFTKFHILFRTKRGLHKASIVESAIKRVKRKLYIFLRSHLTQHWTKYFQDVINSLNLIPMKKLGNLRPIEIQNEAGSVLIDKSLKSNNIPIPKDPTYKIQLKSAQNYENESRINPKLLKTGDYVYKNIKEDLFSKSFDIQVKSLHDQFFNIFSYKNI